MGEQQNSTRLKESFLPRRRGHFGLGRAGLLVSAGAVLVSVFPSAASSGAAVRAARLAPGAEASVHTIVRNPLAKPPGAGECPGRCNRLAKPAGSGECRDAWSMSIVHAGAVWVGDSATGRISVYRPDGTRLRVIDTRLGRDRLAGFALDADGRLTVLEAAGAPAARLRAGSS
jgi:hypothetical protein